MDTWTQRPTEKLFTQSVATARARLRLSRWRGRNVFGLKCGLTPVAWQLNGMGDLETRISQGWVKSTIAVS